MMRLLAAITVVNAVAPETSMSRRALGGAAAASFIAEPAAAALTSGAALPLSSVRGGLAATYAVDGRAFLGVVDTGSPFLLVDGTCDELGRRCAWILLDASGPVSLTLAWDPFTVHMPSDIAERLPKALIHRNVPGERIHALLQSADRAFSSAAPLAPFGPRIRWRAALAQLASTGVPVSVPRRTLRDNVLTVPWTSVQPRQ